MLNFFSKMLIALIFIMIDINIGIDLLPDIIGYFLIAGAVKKLRDIKISTMAFWCTLLLGLFSLLEMLNFQEFLFSGDTVIYYLFSLISGLLLLCYYYSIFNVCLELLNDSPHIRYTKKVKYIMLTSAWLTIMTQAIQLHLNENDMFNFYIIVVIIACITFFIFLIYLYNMKRYAEIEQKRAKLKLQNI